MCGIAVHLGGAVLDPAGLAQSLRHRGPDAWGAWDVALPGGARLQLVHTRLKVLDLTAAAAQPMVYSKDEDAGAPDSPRRAVDGYALVCNGEIYNFRELRGELEAHGHRFRGTGDTEVLLHAYAEWGEAVFDRLDGMFAVAIYDGPRRRLVLARDHAGIKPLYYARLRDGGLLAASEVRTILGCGRCETGLDPAGLEAYLRTGACEEPRTLFAAVRSFPAGHRAAVPLDGGPGRSAVAPEPYWLPERIAVAAAVVLPEWAEEHRTILMDTVRRQLTADVPAGVFLSGGIDSAVLTGLAAAAGRSPLTAFTLGGPATAHDEVAAAVALARQAGVRHAAVALRPEELDRWVHDGLAGTDLPSADGLNLYLVSRAARQAGLVVVLAGTGADELHGAYGHPRRLLRWRRLARLGGAVTGALAAGLRGRVAGERVRALVAAAPAAWRMAGELRRYFTPRQIAAMRPDLGSLPDAPAPPFADGGAFAAQEFAEQVRLAGLSGYLRNTLLRDGDGATMANQQELRVPFLGRRYLEHVLRVPERVTAPEPWRAKPRLAALLAPAARRLATGPKRGFVLDHLALLDRTMRDPFVAATQSLQAAAGLKVDAVAWLQELERTRSPRVAQRVWALLALGVYLQVAPALGDKKSVT